MYAGDVDSKPCFRVDMFVFFFFGTLDAVETSGFGHLLNRCFFSNSFWVFVSKKRTSIAEWKEEWTFHLHIQPSPRRASSTTQVQTAPFWSR